MGGETNEASALLNEFSSRARDMEERHSFLKERIILLGQSILKQDEKNSKELMIIKDELKEMRLDLDRAKEGLQHLIQNSADYVRREELKVFEKYIKMWDPIKAVSETDVKRIVNEILKEKQAQTI